MDIVKQVLAFPLYATVAWLLWVLIQEVGPGAAFGPLFGLVLIGFAVWVYGRTRHAALRGRGLGAGLAAAAGAAALFFAASLTGGAGWSMPEKRWGTCIMTLMRLSARADYALRAAIELAAASSGHVTADQLARAQQIPGKFLETILTQLRRAGLIRSQRGPDGGFWLARPAAEISLADIIRAIDGQLLGVRGERPENVTYPGVAEPLQQVWIALRANERAVLEQVTLADIVSGNLPETIRNLTENPSAWV